MKSTEREREYVKPEVIASYERRQLAEMIRPHGSVPGYGDPGCGGCGCACGCGGCGSCTV